MITGNDRASEIDSLYDAAIDPAIWPDVLHNLAQSLNAVGCCIVIANLTETLVAPPVSADVKELLEDFVEDGWYQRDLRGVRGLRLVQGGQAVVLDHDVCTDEDRRYGAYHNEWLRPRGLPWWAAVAFHVEDRPCALAIFRNSSQGPFEFKDVAHLKSLQAHLARATSLTRRLALSRAENACDLLEHIGRAAFLIDSRGRISRINAGAEKLLAGGLTLRQGSLRAVDAESDICLQRLIGAVLTPQFPSSAPEEGPVVIRRFGRQPLIVRALPVLGQLADVFLTTRALLLITDLEARSIPSADRLRQIFRLTTAEARMATRLAAGEDLNRAAEALGISIGTARAHLKSLFSKTDTHRQSQLMSLILAIGDV